jgi:hypothetical protein
LRRPDNHYFLSRTMAGDTDAEDVLPLERQWTAVGTAITLSIPKNTVTVEIGKEAYNTPIVYRSDNNKKQLLLRVPTSATKPAFQRNMRRTNFLDNLLKNLGPDVEASTKWLLDALAKKSDKIYEEVARERGFITTQTKKMDAHSAAAMWEDAKVSTGQQRKINRHLDAYFGARLTVPESEVRAIGKGNPEVLAAHKKAMEKTTRKRKSRGESSATKNSSEQNLARDTYSSGNLTTE